MEHIWTMLMHKILQNHLLCTFVANLKIDAIYALYPESFCDKNIATRKVFAFCDSGSVIRMNTIVQICTEAEHLSLGSSRKGKDSGKIGPKR